MDFTGWAPPNYCPFPLWLEQSKAVPKAPCSFGIAPNPRCWTLTCFPWAARAAPAGRWDQLGPPPEPQNIWIWAFILLLGFLSRSPRPSRPHRGFLQVTTQLPAHPGASWIRAKHLVLLGGLFLLNIYGLWAKNLTTQQSWATIPSFHQQILLILSMPILSLWHLHITA